jgi:hypothetical protein
VIFRWNTYGRASLYGTTALPICMVARCHFQLDDWTKKAGGVMATRIRAALDRSTGVLE